MSYIYEEDLTGIKVDNLVVDELHAVSESQFKDYKLIIPNFAPFYHTNFKVIISSNGVERELVEDVDYSLTLNYIAGTRTTGKILYGGIQLHDLASNGVLKMTYQTLGGGHLVDRLDILTLLADRVYNPRETVWDTLTNVPVAFPPKPHFQDYDTFYGQEVVVKSLDDIAEAIATNTSLTLDTLNDFIALVGGGSFDTFLKKSGDVMEGPLELFRDPLEPKEAVTLRHLQETYVSNEQWQYEKANIVNIESLAAALNNKLSTTGGRLTGPLLLHDEPVHDDQAVTKSYVDNLIGESGNELNGLKQRVTEIESNFTTRKEVEEMVGEVMARLTAYGSMKINM